MTFLPLKNEYFNDIGDFIGYLEGLQNDYQIPSNLQIVATLSNFNSLTEFIDSLVKRDFVIENDFGKLLYISKKLRDEKIYYYTFFDDRNNVPLFLTVARKTDDIPETLLDYVKKSKDLSNLWIAPKAMNEIKDELVDKYPDLLITYFSAKRSPFTDIPAEFRPDVERGIQYRGDDGKSTLDEMQYYYGVLPKILEIKLPNGVAFRIDNKGIITLKHGDFSEIFGIIENLIKKLITIKNKIKGSSYSIRKVGINKQFKNYIQTPWSITLPSKMEYDDVSYFCKAIQSEDWEFTLIDDILMNGSMFFSARFIDNNNSSVFDITTTGSKIDVYPVDKADIGTSMKFYQFIIENIDPLAEVR